MYKTSSALALVIKNSTTMHIIVNIYCLVMNMGMIHLLDSVFLDFFVQKSLLCIKESLCTSTQWKYEKPESIKVELPRVTCVLKWLHLLFTGALGLACATESSCKPPG